MKQIGRPSLFFDEFHRKPAQPETTHYCPGCGHGTLQKILADCLDELGLQDRALLVAPVGCAVFMYYYFRCACVSAPHGRAPSVATGLGRSHPDAVVVSYQGDGDLAAIGTNNIIHAANRGENMLVLFVNNNTYGMTGGQLAPTTLIGQPTVTSPQGRTLLNDGAPLRMAEIIATLGGPVYVARVALCSPRHNRETRKVVRRALEIQAERKGFAFVEVLSSCPTNWHMTPAAAMGWIESTVVPEFPLGVLKDLSDVREPQIRELRATDTSAFAALLGGTGVASDVPVGNPAMPFDEVRFKGAGFGGQGVLSMGLVLAHSAVHAGVNVAWLPSYGPEMRGGVANCAVVLDRSPVASPVVSQPNLLVALNAPSIEKFGPMVAPDGVTVVNRSLVNAVPKDLPGRVYAVPVTDMARDVGDVRTANTVALGVMSRVAGLFDCALLEAGLRSVFRKTSTFEINRKALLRGYEAGEKALQDKL